MNDMYSDSIEHKLRQAWRQEQRFHHLRGISVLVLWLVALLLLDFLIDWGIVFRSRLGINTGMVLLAINVVVLAWVFWREWFRHLRPFDAVLVSLDVEDKHPELASLLVSYSQLHNEADMPSNVSQELIEAMCDQAVIQTKPIDFRDVIDFVQLKKLLIVTVCIILFFGAASVNWKEHLSILLQRLIGSTENYPTQTTVIPVTKNVTVKAGDSQAILADVQGLVPSQGTIYTKPANGEGDWVSAPFDPLNKGATFSRTITEVNEDLQYYVRIGDDQSDIFNITVAKAPQIASVQVVLKYPDYMNSPAGKHDQLNLDNVPEGTEVQWTITTQEPVNQLEVSVTASERKKPTEDAKPLAKEDAPPAVRAKVSNGGKTLTFNLPAPDSFKYTFRWTKKAGEKEFHYDDVQHFVRVSADEVPDIDLITPRVDAKATLRKKVHIRAKAFDDHGLSTARLVYSLNGSEEKSVQLHDFQGEPTGEFTHVWDLKKSIPDLELKTRISYAIEIVDLYPNKVAHTNRSVTRQFTIVNDGEYLQWYNEEIAIQQEEIKRARATEITSGKKVKTLKEQESPSK
jgi:hypothetical protein